MGGAPIATLPARRAAATSCGLDRDQFILYVVELHEAGMGGVMLEMKRYCLKNISTKFLPGFCLGEDGMVQCAREVTAFLSIVNFEDQFHASRIPEAEESRHLRALRLKLGLRSVASGPIRGYDR